VLALMLPVCWAIEAAHIKGAIHRNIKPSNVPVTSNGTPHVLDFGLAKACGKDEAEPTISLARDLAGTLAHMPQSRAAGYVDEIDAAEYAARLDRAIGDITSVRDAFLHRSHSGRCRS
jgi:serine/threonine protein kinase